MGAKASGGASLLPLLSRRACMGAVCLSSSLPERAPVPRRPKGEWSFSPDCSFLRVESPAQRALVTDRELSFWSDMVGAFA